MGAAIEAVVVADAVVEESLGAVVDAGAEGFTVDITEAVAEDVIAVFGTAFGAGFAEVTTAGGATRAGTEAEAATGAGIGVEGRGRRAAGVAAAALTTFLRKCTPSKRLI